MHFTGFDPDAVRLLKELPRFGEAEYKVAKEALAAGLRIPALALVETVARQLDAGLSTSPRASISPFHRDLRFAKPGTPRYKDHLMATMWTGADKKVAPTLWIRMDSDSIGFASGIAFTPEIQARFREAVSKKSGEQLDRALAIILKEHAKHSVDLAGDQLKKVPNPFPQDHPRADLLKRKGLQIRFKVPLPKSVSKAEFARVCEKHLRDLLPVHQWLVKYVG